MRLSLSSCLFPREYKWEVRCSIWLLSTRTKSHFPYSIRAARRGDLNAQINQYWGALVLKSAFLPKARQVILITCDPLCRLEVWNLSCKHELVYILWERMTECNPTEEKKSLGDQRRKIVQNPFKWKGTWQNSKKGKTGKQKIANKKY